MGFGISVLYFVTYYLTPTTVFGPLAVVRIQLILAALAFIVSLPALIKSFALKIPQSLALIGLALAVFLSVLIGMHWVGGARDAFLGFIPNAFAFFLVCLHCNSKKKLQVLVLMLLFVCLFVIAHGSFDLLHGVPESNPAPGVALGDPLSTGPTASPYVLRQFTDADQWIYRLRGLGNIHDPNDFAQLIVCVTPLVFIFWRKKKRLWNFAVVILPVCVLVFGAYLTHSRGSLLALTAVVIVAARRRIGGLPSLLLAGGLFVAASTLHFTGGRDISANAGAGRTDLWGESMQVFKTHPLFGVGFGNLGDYTENGLTAHNSVAVCAAELGMFGLYFWSLFLFPTLRDALAIASPQKVSQGGPIAAEDDLFPQAAWTIEEIDKAEFNRLGRLLVLSLTGFLIAGWFLSRAFVMTLFLLGGMTEVVFQMALQRGMIAPRLSQPRMLGYAGGMAISLVLVMNIVLRILNLMR